MGAGGGVGVGSGVGVGVGVGLGWTGVRPPTQPGVESLFGISVSLVTPDPSVFIV